MQNILLFGKLWAVGKLRKNFFSKNCCPFVAKIIKKFRRKLKF